MDCFIPRPSAVNREFYERYRKDPQDATGYFYQLSQNSRYIKMDEIRKNISYKVSTAYGDLDITINLSKPEKDPKAISKAKAAGPSRYPLCLLCIENEGFLGRPGHPARSQHRTVRVQLAGERWHFQYSPYVYYNEHCILLSEKHRPMKIDAMTFQRLLDFVRQFPHYFLGSNADLPIVGGSILSHDHYQGGNYLFPMAKAQMEEHFQLKDFPDVKAGIVHWPMPVIRLQCEDAETLVACGDYILGQWKTYNDPSVDIFAFTDKTPHNTITPIARIRNGRYELDLVLRNNRTSPDHPLGIFHPHEDVHHIKKENIGLIEVMGLAVLPARLKRELEDVEQYLLDEPNNIKDYHVPWANHMKEIYRGRLTKTSVTDIVRREVGMKFLRVLEDAAVFKQDERGKAAFRRFIVNQLYGEMES
jgi:UDPglucose--hexose-1-phosphate uridylyltransferase